MKRTLRILGCLTVLIALLALGGCGFKPSSLASVTTLTAALVPAGSSSSTTSVAATTAPAPEAPAPAPKKFAPAPAPATLDVLLASGNWGYHSSTKYETKLSSGVTDALHSTMEQDEIDDLTAEQSCHLRSVFRDSTKVHHAIDEAGGDSSDATYTVVTISASDDVGIDTPWVTATLRACFPTRDGHKALEVSVYRQKTRFGLDNRPFVSSAIVGYTLEDGSIHNPKQIRL